MTEGIDNNISPYINAYNIHNVNPTSVEHLANTQALEETSDSQSSINLSDQIYSYGSTLTQNITNSTNGLAMAQLAQAGLENQQNRLAEIEKLTLQIMDTTDPAQKELLVNEISDQLDQYEEVANTTTLHNKALLKTSGDSSDDISIVNSESITEISKADTTSISDSLRFFLNEFDADENSMGNMLQTLHNSQKQLASFSNDFSDAADQLQASVKEAIMTEVNKSKSSTTLDIDYSKEVTDFSKSNILAQMGYIMQVQPNAQQQKTVSLLS
jgi:flagellin-like hook-associated protein FlgL